MIKRSFDIIVSTVGIILFAPLFVILYFLIRYKLGKPVIFTQIRPGLFGEPFKLYKFRTMSNLKDRSGKLLNDIHRLDEFGRFLRSVSCDELPALWNVMKGEMSLVGPRPLLLEYLPLYNHFQARRHEVKPGITGWAQVNGRNVITWNEKFDLDVWYVDNRSFWLDVKIILLTIKKVFLKEGITEPGEVTMSKFTGNNK